MVKTIIKVWFVAILFISQLSLIAQEEDPLSVMSFNVRYDNPADSGQLWKDRLPLAVEIIQTQKVDLIGFQEVLPHQLDSLSGQLKNYGFYGVGRDDGKREGEMCPVFYRTDRFSVIASGTFWLSDDPKNPGMGWDAVCPRICSWVKFEDKSGSEDILFASTHLDHKGRVARKESAYLLKKQLSKIAKKAKIILVGDFNAEPQSYDIKILTESQFKDAFVEAGQEAAGPVGTFHNFGRIFPESQPRIDYIFFDKKSEISGFRTLQQQQKGLYPSDHYPIVATFK